MSEDPHSRALRRHRWTSAGLLYAVTTVVKDRAPLLGPLEGALVLDALLWLRRAGRARLYAFVVMPEHVHLVLEPAEGHSISDVMKSWKSFSARQIHDLNGSRGAFWQDGFHERVIRDDRDLEAAVRYLHQNPVEAGLVKRPEEYLLSSAHPSHKGQVDLW